MARFELYDVLQNMNYVLLDITNPFATDLLTRSTPTSFVYDISYLGQSITGRIEGTGLTYLGTGDIVGGVAHSWTVSVNNAVAFSITEAQIDFAEDPTTQEDFFSDLDDLLFGGNDTIIGNSYANALFGDDGDDIIDGAGGDDILDGGDGSDVIDGGAGLDKVFVSSLDDDDQEIFQFNGTVYALDRDDGSFDVISNVEIFTDGEQTIGLAQIETFDALAYAASYDDLAQAFRTNADAAIRHYLVHGFSEDRETDFDAEQYLANYSDLRAAFGNDTAGAARHFVNFGVDEHRLAESPLEYIASFADLMAAFGGGGIDEMKQAGLSHYANFGSGEGRRGGIDFDAEQYLENWADLAAAFGTDAEAAALHFINHGHAERRLADDPLDYIASHADLVEAFGGARSSKSDIVLNGLNHYGAFGSGEGRQADEFDVDQYLANYADLRTAFADGLGGYDEDGATLHYIQHGYFEGRTDDLLFA